MQVKINDKMVICKGRLKGEVVTVIGESNLNMEQVIIVSRTKGRKRTMGFVPSWLRKMTLIERFNRLPSRAFGQPSKCKYLMPPDKRDSRWGIDHFGGCEPITAKRAEQIISKMEQKQEKLLKG